MREKMEKNDLTRLAGALIAVKSTLRRVRGGASACTFDK
jgi:hypothetical protein